jgi:hopanoid C-3 methylase
LRAYAGAAGPPDSPACRHSSGTLAPLTPFLQIPFFKLYEDRLLFARDDYEKWSFSQVVIRPSRMRLRRYYYEVLKSYLYINLWSNNLGCLVRRFGPGTVLRLARGAVHVMGRYLRLMREASA